MTHNNRGNRRANPLPATVRRARELAGLTQKAAGALLHTTWRVWAAWESGDRRMHPAFFHLFLLRTKLENHPELEQDLPD